MNEIELPAGQQLERRARDVPEGGDTGRAHLTGNRSQLPVFGEWERREFEDSSSPMRIFDLETLRYLAVNEASVRFYGYSREEFLGMTVLDTRHSEEHAALRETLTQHTGFIRHRLPRRHLKKSGEVAVVGLVSQDIRFEGRRARLSMVIDITARVLLHELLWQRQQEFETLAEHLPDLVSRYDARRRFVYVNAAIENLFGMTRDRFIGRTQHEVGTPADIVALYDDSLDLVLETGCPHKVEFRITVADGERQFEALHVPERDTEGNVSTVICVARDITERKRTELALRRGAELARLQELLARAANEAMTPEAAMESCLALICAHGKWMIGRVAWYGSSGSQFVPLRSIWRRAEDARFASFIRACDSPIPFTGKRFIGRVLREKVPVWVEDLNEFPGFDCRSAASTCGICSAFAFPVIVRGQVAAVMEVFADEPRPEDPLVLRAAQTIASQLARIVERESAFQANARMAAIVESSQDAILSRKLDGTVLTWNAGAERLFGYTAEEIVGRNVLMIVPPERRAEANARWALVGQGLPVPVRETVGMAKDGRRIHISTGPAPIRDSSGAVCGVSTIIRDITEQKRAETTLQESEERFRQLAENIRQVFWISSLDSGEIFYVSPAFEEIWGRSRESLYRDAKEWMNSIHPDDRSATAKSLKRIARGEGLDVGYRIIRPDGSVRWIRDRSYEMKAADGTVLACGIAEDVTDGKLAEEERLSQAIHQRDALVREVHHRIKNSLQGVVGLLRQKIRKYPSAAPDIEEAIGQLQSVALVYGLQETRPDGLLSLAEITNAICNSVEKLVGGRVQRTFEQRSVRPACVSGSEAVSVAVVLNELVFNALKHQPAGKSGKQAAVRLSGSRGTAEIRISNRGRLPRAFDYESGRGIGHGLGLVRALLAAPGGSIAFNRGRDQVEVVLKLHPPLLAERHQVSAGGMAYGDE